jgi:hypothetical protein
MKDSGRVESMIQKKIPYCNVKIIDQSENAEDGIDDSPAAIARKKYQ